MATLPVPTTELEAVNAMLGAIGEAPVNTLQVTGIDDVAVAKQVLLEITRAVLTRGWHFNTDYNYPLNRDVSNNFIVPPNALKIRPMPRFSATYDVTVRAGKLWWKNPPNEAAPTFDFSTANDSQIKFTIVWGFKFDELPEYVRRYIYIRAARVFTARRIGDAELEGLTEKDELEAKVSMDSDEGFEARRNLFRSNRIMRKITNRYI